jgi:cobalamin biosynthesis protein CobT
MGILDKAKAAAGKVAEEAKKGSAQVQDKVEHAQTRKKADALAEQLGYLIVKERSGGEAAGAEADRLVGEIQALEAKLAAASDPAAGEETPE